MEARFDSLSHTARLVSPPLEASSEERCLRLTYHASSASFHASLHLHRTQDPLTQALQEGTGLRAHFTLPPSHVTSSFEVAVRLLRHLEWHDGEDGRREGGGVYSGEILGGGAEDGEMLRWNEEERMIRIKSVDLLQRPCELMQPFSG